MFTISPTKFLFLLLCAISVTYGLELQDFKSKNIAMQGRFLQEKYLQHFKQTLTSNGEFQLNQNQLFWHILAPIQQKLKITNNGIFTENPQTQTWQELKQNYDKKLILDLLNFDFIALQKYFVISIKGNSEQWQITLTPNNIWLNKIFKTIHLEGSEYLHKIIFIEVNGDQTTNTFHHITKLQ